MPNSPYIRVVAAAAALAVPLALGACQSSSPSILDRKLGPPSSGSGQGDLDDIDISVDTALARAGVAPTGLEILPDGTRIWELRNARDEPGELIVRIGTPDREGGPIPVEMTCRMGRFGDPRTEKLILESAATRLEQLKGRDVYRITWR